VKRKISDLVWRTFLRSVLFAIVLGILLWVRFNWLPNVQVDTVRSLLVSIVQSQASIWAIAVSFSLLYVQISVDAYSLRAARLLVQNTAFVQMTRDYVLSLSINSLMALFVTPQPSLLPLLFGVVGVMLFINGLAVMVKYISYVVHYVTPDAIIHELRARINTEQIQQEALEITLEKQVGGRWVTDPGQITVRMPTEVEAQSPASEELRILIDLAKRMVRRWDHIAVKAAIDAIVGSAGYWRQYMPLLPNATAEEIENKQAADLAAGAVLAYLAGALMEIWTTAIQSEDPITAAMIVTAMRKVLGSNVLDDFVACTNVLEGTVYDRMFEDTNRLGWMDVRRRVISLLTGRLSRSSYEELASGPVKEHRNASEVLYLLTRMGRVLLEVDKSDLADASVESEWDIFRAISVLGVYGAAVGNPSMVSGVSSYLCDLAECYRAKPWWHSIGYKQSQMPKLVGEMGRLWVRSDPETGRVDRTFRELLEGAEQVVAAFNERWKESPFSSPANSCYLDALEWIARACVSAEQWPRLQATLSCINRLVTGGDDLPSYATFGFERIIREAIRLAKHGAIDLWAKAVAEFLDCNGSLMSSYDYARLMQGTAEARESALVEGHSELGVRLAGLAGRLTEMQMSTGSVNEPSS